MFYYSLFESFFGLVLIGFIVYLFIKVRSLSKRVEALESKNFISEAPREVVTESRDVYEKVEQRMDAPNGEEKSVKRDPVDDVFTISFTWFRKDWMLKTGALFLLAGMGWFVTFAFMENWIGPLGRITLGYALGLIFLVYGWKKMQDKDFMRKAAVFFVVGASVIILTTYVARSVYDMFSAVTVIFIIFLTSTFVSLAAVKYEKALGYVGLILGSMAPLLSSMPELDYVFLFAYLAVVILGSHIIVHLTGQRGIILAGLIIVAFYSLPYMTDSHARQQSVCSYVYPANASTYTSPAYTCITPSIPNIDYGILLLFAYGFAAIFFLASIIGILRSSALSSYKTEQSDLFTAIGTALFLVAWVMRAAPEYYQGMILIAWMMVFVIGAFLLFQRVKERAAFYTYALVGILLLGTATSIELGGLSRLVAFTLEAATIVVGTMYLLKDKRTTITMTGTFAVPILYSFGYLFDRFTFLDSKSLSLFFLAGVLLLLSFLFYKEEEGKVESEKDYSIFKFYLISGSLYFWVLVWRSVEALFSYYDSMSTTVSLVIFTIAGLSLYIAGKVRNSSGAVLYGSTLSLFVIAHLLLIDVWNMDLFGKVVTFLIVGALLMGSAFIGNKSGNNESK